MACLHFIVLALGRDKDSPSVMVIAMDFPVLQKGMQSQPPADALPGLIIAAQKLGQ